LGELVIEISRIAPEKKETQTSPCPRKVNNPLSKMVAGITSFIVVGLAYRGKDNCV
jgi:hypothetical protein